MRFISSKLHDRQFIARIALFLLPVLGAVGLVSSCKDSLTDAPPPNIVFPDSGISYHTYVEPLFLQACASGGCHSGADPAASLNLETPSYHSVLDHVPQLVVQHDGEHSPLVWWLDGRIAPRMPIGRQPLTQNQINGVKKWIDEGAFNN